MAWFVRTPIRWDTLHTSGSPARTRGSRPLFCYHNGWYHRPVHLYANISVSKATRTMGHGALELPFDGERCIQAPFTGAFVTTDRPNPCTQKKCQVGGEREAGQLTARVS